VSEGDNNPADSRCPRCGGGFHCGVNDPLPCACTALVLSAELRARLRAQYTGCLCLRCLHELSAPQAASHTTG
jgi:hypothetical protein